MDQNSNPQPNLGHPGPQPESTPLQEHTQPQPQPQPSLSPVLDQPSTTTPSPQPSKFKSPKFKKILAISIASVTILIASVSVAAFMVVRNQPSSVARDMIGQLFSTNKIAIKTKVKYDLKDLGFLNNAIKFAELELDQKSEIIPNQNTITVKLIDLSDKQHIVSLQYSISRDGVIYLRANNLSTTISDLKAIAGTELEGLNPYLPQIKDFENQWWSVPISELIQLAFSDQPQLSPDFNFQPKSDPIPCIVKQIPNLANDKNKISEIFDKNPFLNLSDYSGNKYSPKSGEKLYDGKIEIYKAIPFYIDTIKATTYKNLLACVYGDKEAETIINLLSVFSVFSQPESISSVFNGAIDTNQYLFGIDSWTHRLKSFYLIPGDQKVAPVEMNFEYDNIKVEIPSEAKPLKELYDKFTNPNSTLSNRDQKLKEFYQKLKSSGPQPIENVTDPA